MKKILLKDLAEELGISISQVSRALNQKADVAPQIRSRAVELARKMNYRNCSVRHRKTVAVILGWFADFYDATLNRILEQSGKRGWRIVVIPYQHIELLNDQLFDGAIMISGERIAMKWHERYNIPLVVINNFGSALNKICSVFPDADGEVRAAMEHLIALGHTRIARIRGCGPRTTREELARGLEEFFRIAEQHGIRDIVQNRCGASLEEKIGHVRELIAEGYTAFLVVISDEAPVLLDAIRKCGKRIPEDISVITYESRPVSAFQLPPLTTLEYNYSRLVSNALSQLACEMNGGESKAQIIVPVRMNIRGSTGPCAERV